MGNHEADATPQHVVVGEEEQVVPVLLDYLADMATYFQFQIDRCTQGVGRRVPDCC